MRMVALGRLDDIRGFALAGVETVRCETLQEAGPLVQALGADTTVGLVVVPGWLARAASLAIERVRGRRRAPVILVLPDIDADR